MLTKSYIRMQSWMASDDGATAVEYGVMVSLIAVVIIATVTALGGKLDDLFKFVSDSLVTS